MRAFPLRFLFRQRLRLIWRTAREETILRELIRSRGPTQVDFGRVLFRLAQEEIASGQVSVDFNRGAVRLRRGERRGRRFR